jgi:hypothetical protein
MLTVKCHHNSPSKKCHQKDRILPALHLCSSDCFRLNDGAAFNTLHNKHSTVPLRCYVMSTLVFLMAICAKSVAAHQKLELCNFGS